MSEPEPINIQVNTQVMANFWDTKGYDIGVFQCLSDIPTTLAVCCCFPLTLGYAAGQLDQKGFNLVACLCAGIYSYRLRRHVQSRYSINEHEDASTCAVGLCTCCATIQDLHQLEKHGAVKLLGGANNSAGAPAVTAQPQSTPAPKSEPAHSPEPAHSAEATPAEDD